MTGTWVIMPILANRDYTVAAIADVLAQSVPTRLLLLNQGVDDVFRTELEAIAEQQPDRVFVWHHVPPLPSLAASWNRALDFVWSVGGTEALVVNNDVRLHRETLSGLNGVLHRTQALFVTAVGVTPDQFDPTASLNPSAWLSSDEGAPDRFYEYPVHPGGPDFSCFLISAEGHARYRFDEHFVPAFCEDLDTHRRYLLNGDGDKIFSVNLPYLHYGSATLKTMDAGKRAATERAISAGSRAYYEKKWGGPVNQERYTIPFDRESGQVGVTTPELQARA